MLYCQNMVEKIEKKIIYPENLSETDIALVNKQCELQHATSKEQIEGFAAAYIKAKQLAENIDEFKQMNGADIEALILQLAEMIESGNSKGYRSVEVKFAGGGSALKAELVPRAMESFSKAYAEALLEPVEAYTEFEKIHPFEDGNGRVGDLLWKMAVKRESGKWPEELPPDVFGKKN